MALKIANVKGLFPNFNPENREILDFCYDVVSHLVASVHSNYDLYYFLLEDMSDHFALNLKERLELENSAVIKKVKLYIEFGQCVIFVQREENGVIKNQIITRGGYDNSVYDISNIYGAVDFAFSGDLDGKNEGRFVGVELVGVDENKIPCCWFLIGVDDYFINGKGVYDFIDGLNISGTPTYHLLYTRGDIPGFIALDGSNIDYAISFGNKEATTGISFPNVFGIKATTPIFAFYESNNNGSLQLKSLFYQSSSTQLTSVSFDNNMTPTMETVNFSGEFKEFYPNCLSADMDGNTITAFLCDGKIYVIGDESIIPDYEEPEPTPTTIGNFISKNGTTTPFTKIKFIDKNGNETEITDFNFIEN